LPELRIDTPCGQVVSKYDARGDDGFDVSFIGVPSFVLAANQILDLPDYGQIRYSIAYGGAFYAYVDASQINLRLDQDNVQEINFLGRLIKKLITASDVSITHPFEADLSFLYGVIFESRHKGNSVFAKNVCVFADGEIDRSPTGSGVCGNLGILHREKTIGKGEKIIFESIINSQFRGSVMKETTFGNIPAVIPQVEGTAFITGLHTFLLDSQDPFGGGFLVR
jgi:trans-L-3-hydroxyproline dehydratase